ncbi:MAG: DUF2249 domain-containing protein [Nocardioides sp.]|nr:DUF2249 domain-containing protein [Nocardioides sp.]
MTTLTIASDSADAEAVEAVENHHAQMSGELALLVANLVNAADGGGAISTRNRLVAWSRESLVPHALAEEKTLYPAARELTEARLLVDAMLAEHVAIVAMVDEVERAATHVAAAAAGRALQALFAVHLDKENDQLLPLLAASPNHSVALLLEGMHEVLGGGHEGPDHGDAAESESEKAAGHGGSGCACGTVDPPGHPELDVRVIPHAIRHATIFGALDAVAPGAGLEIVADHDPIPLLDQVRQRTPGRFDITYLERGPVDFRVQFVAVS